MVNSMRFGEFCSRVGWYEYDENYNKPDAEDLGSLHYDRIFGRSGY